MRKERKSVRYLDTTVSEKGEKESEMGDKESEMMR